MINLENQEDLSYCNQKKIKYFHKKWDTECIDYYCQTCGFKLDNFSNSFCSFQCYNISTNLYKGGCILPIINYFGEICLILIKDHTRKKYFSELVGGKKENNETDSLTSAREATEELGLNKFISPKFLEKNSLKFIVWFKNKIKDNQQLYSNSYSNSYSNDSEYYYQNYQNYQNYKIYDNNYHNLYNPSIYSLNILEEPIVKEKEKEKEIEIEIEIEKDYKKLDNQEDLDNSFNFMINNEEEIKDNYHNFSVYVMKFKNFNIKASNQAAKSRLKDNNIKKEWKETECIYLVPLNNFEKYIDDKTTNILDYKGNKIPPLSFRWIKFLKNKKNFNIIKQYANNKNITEWDITSIQKQNNTLGLNSYGFIWNNQDLKNSN